MTIKQAIKKAEEIYIQVDTFAFVKVSKKQIHNLVEFVKFDKVFEWEFCKDIPNLLYIKNPKLY